MERGIGTTKNYNKPGALRYEQAKTRGSVYLFVLILLVFGLFILSIFLFGLNVVRIGLLFVMFSFLTLNTLYYTGYFESGIETDFIRFQFRKYVSRGKLRRGKWQAIDRPDYLLIVKDSSPINRWRSKRGLGRYYQGILFEREPYFYYQLYLITKGKQDLHLFTSESFEFNLETASHISNHLNIDVFERNTNEVKLVYKPDSELKTN